jgi:hypothetical protein
LTQPKYRATIEKLAKPMTFDLELLKTLLGLFSIIGATASGVAALVVDYKDKETGKITKWGRYALSGLAISLLIGVSNLWIDYTEKSRATTNAAEESRANSEKTLKILTDISRTLNPFKDVRVDFNIIYPFDDPDLLQYRQRLDTQLRPLLPDISRKQEIQGVHWAMMLENGTVKWVTINQGSPLLPNASEHLPSGLFFRRGLMLYWFKAPIDPTTFDDNDDHHADITMELLSANDEDSQKIDVEYDLQTQEIRFQAFGAQTKPENWESSGQIVSLLDLPGSQLIVQLEYDSAVTAFANSKDRLKRINLPESIHLVIGVAERRSWNLSKWNFKKYKGPFGTTNFVYLFPKTYAELLQQ